MSAVVETPVIAPVSVIKSISIGPYILYPDSGLVDFVDGWRQARLTKFEMALLSHLAARPGIAVGKEELARLMYNGRGDPKSNSLEVFVGRIRRKIDPVGQYKPLLTVRGSGYSFRNDWVRA